MTVLVPAATREAVTTRTEYVTLHDRKGRPQEYRVIPLSGVDSFLVSSRTTKDGWHLVTDGRCPCYGYTLHRACSHTEAIARRNG